MADSLQPLEGTIMDQRELESTSDAHVFGAENTLLFVIMLVLSIFSGYMLKKLKFPYLPESGACMLLGILAGKWSCGYPQVHALADWKCGHENGRWIYIVFWMVCGEGKEKRSICDRYSKHLLKPCVREIVQIMTVNLVFVNLAIVNLVIVNLVFVWLCNGCF